MITLNFSVDDQLLTRTDENTVAANSHLVHTCEFVFSSEWNGRGKVATFKKRDLMLSVILDDDACTIPPEILQSENKIDIFELSVCGADGNSTITSTVVKVPILAGTWDPFTEEITPTLFEQIMDKIDEIEKGEISPELVLEAVTEYMEAHPLEPIVAEDVAAYFEEHKSEFKGDTGTTPEITVTAEVNNAVGTPSVTVTKTGTTEAPNLNFAFQNLKGSKGDTGVTPTINASATVDANVGTPSVTVTKSGTAENPNLAFAFHNLKGVKGDTGNGIASIEKTATSGLVDTYTITFTNGNTTTFTVSNGLGIKSADINANGHLIITYSDDTTYDAGALSDIYATAADVDAKLNGVWKSQGELGAKNLLTYPYQKERGENHGVTMTVNSDGSVILNGTASNIDAQNTIYDLNASNPLILKEGAYIFSVNGLDASTMYAELLIRDSLNSWRIIINSSTANPNPFVITQQIAEKIATREYRIQIKICVRRDQTVDNVTVYPMIRYASDSDDTWQPYAKTNKNLTDDVKRIDEVINNVPSAAITSITCWGDSLTAQVGWTQKLATLSGIPVYNGGTGGENSKCIMARQGGDVMIVDGITIPATTTPVTIASRASDNGISTQFGNKVMPLLQGGGTHVNPVTIGDITGTLAWTGSDYADQNGTWTFTRATAGEEIIIDRPTAIRTNFDINHNGKNELMIIFMGQNGGWNDSADLIHQHKLMIDHFKGKEYVILGLSSGTATSRADYEAAMKEAFGRRFISLREYLAHPIYENGEIVSCYGLADQNLTPTTDDLEKIAIGQVPASCLVDSVHYTVGTREVVGNMLYKKLCELNIL